MRILVSGGSGFIGYNLSKRLIEDGHDVYSTSGGTGNSAVGTVLYRGLSGINIQDLPIRIDYLIHNSANNDTRYSNTESMMRTNVEDSLRLFNICYNRGCRKFIYASSTAVYGNSPIPFIEDKTPFNPQTPYASSKIELEKDATSFAQDKNVQMIGLRYCNVYGPGEYHKGIRASMIYKLLRQKTKTETPTLFKDGTQRRDWIHINDVVEANVLAIKSNQSGIFNVGTGVSISFIDLVKEIFGTDQIKWLECLPDYQSNTCCDITKIEKALGFAPKVKLKDGIQAYLRDSTW